MEDLLEIKVICGLPMISLKKELKESDLAPVSEKENSIRFIFDDDAWEYDGDIYSLKLRFRVAAQLDQELREMSASKKVEMSQKHWTDLASICRVRQIVSNSEETKDQLEQTLYLNSLQKLTEAIDEFNVTTMMSGVTK